MKTTHLLLGPVVTEKSTAQQARNKYTLVVNSKANKVEIKQFFKEVYGVHVTDVNLFHRWSKSRFGKGRRLIEKRPNHKRAIITLKEGEKLNLSLSKTTA